MSKKFQNKLPIVMLILLFLASIIEVVLTLIIGSMFSLCKISAEEKRS